MHRLKIMYLSNYDTTWPEISHEPGNMCFDMRAAISHPVELLPGEKADIPLGVKFDMADEQCLEVFARSSLSKRMLIICNSVGIIDCDYRGELIAPIVNIGTYPQIIEPGERIVQARVVTRIRTIFHKVTELSQTARGEGGFGSTGRF